MSILKIAQLHGQFNAELKATSDADEVSRARRMMLTKLIQLIEAMLQEN